MRVLFGVAAHGDDIALGCAGAIAKYVKAHDEARLTFNMDVSNVSNAEQGWKVNK